MSEMLVTNMAQGQVVVFDGITHTFFSYGVPIARRMGLDSYINVVDAATLDGFTKQGKPPLNFSKTTRKYLWEFLCMTQAEAYAAVESGRIQIVKELV